jgi:hypothetical protein
MPIHEALLPGFSFNDAALFLYIANARWQHSVLFTVFARWCEKSRIPFFLLALSIIMARRKCHKKEIIEKEKKRHRHLAVKFGNYP